MKGRAGDRRDQDLVPLRFDDPSLLLPQAFELFFNPEIARRLADGTMDNTFELEAAQVVFHAVEPTEIRFNDEVDGQLAVIPNRDFKEGESVSLSDFDAISGIEMVERDGDRAHITVFYGPNPEKPWVVLADSRFNLARARALAVIAEEYLLCAEGQLEGLQLRSAISNLFYAVEAVAQAEWTLLPDPEALKQRNHRSWHTQHHRISKMGVVSEAAPALHRELLAVRDLARYDLTFEIDGDRVRGWVRGAREGFDRLSERLDSELRVDLAA